jgi:hypothetical protein
MRDRSARGKPKWKVLTRPWRLVMWRHVRRAPGYCGLVWRAVTLLTTAFIVAGLPACSGAPTRSGHSVPGPATSSLISLSCADSAGQQGGDHETVVGGVEGLALPGSDDPAGLYPIGASDGKRYFIYKAFLAVSATAAPYDGLHHPPRGRQGCVRLAVAHQRADERCFGPGAARGFAGGGAAARVRAALHRFHRRRHRHRACLRDFQVSSQSARTASVSVPIGPGKC